MTPQGSTSPPTRIALIGAGRMGQVHLAALESSDEITVAGVVKPLKATCERLQAGGLVVYESVRQLLDSAAMDAVLQVGYWRRFVPELRLREQIAGGEHAFERARWLLGDELEAMVALPAGPSTQPRPASDPDSAILLASTSGGTAVTISLERQFPHPDSCWVEAWGTQGYARIPFMWGAEGEDVFRVSMRRQAEAFARAVGGAPCEGAQAPDAIAAQLVAARAAEALSAGIADVSPTLPA